MHFSIIINIYIYTPPYIYNKYIFFHNNWLKHSNINGFRLTKNITKKVLFRNNVVLTRVLGLRKTRKYYEKPVF